MTKDGESLRGLHDLHVLLVLCELGRPAKAIEIKEETKFRMAPQILSIMAQRGYVDHDEDACTWCINDAGRAHLIEISQREIQEYRSWNRAKKKRAQK